MTAAHRLLVRALARHLGPLDDLDGRIRDWASVTFTGLHHQIDCSLEWTSEIESRLANLSEVDLPMRGFFVADLIVTDRHRAGDRLRVSIEALTIKED